MRELSIPARALLGQVCFFAPAALGQSPIYEFAGEAAEDLFGEAVSGVGDVNGDGLADVAVGARLNDGNGTDSGSVSLFSGADGTLLYTLNGDSAGDQMGVSVSGAGDVDGDGVEDLVVGAIWPLSGQPGYARVFSGASGAVLHTVWGDAADDSFGFSVSGAGDVNADGHADIIVGSFLNDVNGMDSGSARVFSGADASVLYEFHGDSAGDFLGYSVSGAGDVNGDGFADIVAGAWHDDNNGTDSGSARVFSGVDGSILFTFVGDDDYNILGHSVSGAGDVNGDGFDDVIAGASRNNNNGQWSGLARVFSGMDGAVLHTFEGDSSGEEFGDSVSGAGDVNGDGFADLIVGAAYDSENGHTAGSARVLSGFDGALLFTIHGQAAGDMLGFSVSAAGDVNGDGYDDLIVGAGRADKNGPESGIAFVLSGCGMVGSPYCSPAVANSSGRPAEIRAYGTTELTENRLHLTSSQLPLDQFGYFIASETRAISVNFGGGPGTLCLGGEIGRFDDQVLVSGPNGTFELPVDLTDMPPPAQQVVLAGETWTFQAWFRDLASTETSNFSDAVSVTFR